MAIEGWRFLETWERTVVPKLEAAGFEVRGDNALRKRGKSLELISLERDSRDKVVDPVAALVEPAKRGGRSGRFTINLALAHEFARSYRNGEALEMDGYEEAVFHARLGRLIQGRDVWWDYGVDVAACEKTLAAVSDVTIAYAEAWFETLVEPGVAYLLLKKGDLGRENLWNLALYAWHLGHREDALDWLKRIRGPAAHVRALIRAWSEEMGLPTPEGAAEDPGEGTP